MWLPSLIIIHFLITLCSRVQWFWHFFRNSICFMCFWLGLEILRLVYKKALFEILNSFYLTWPFILQKSSAAPYKSWKKCLQHWVYRVSKKAKFCADFKNVQKSWVWPKGKNCLEKNWIFRDLENLTKIIFLRKNHWKLFGTRVLHIFEISTKFRFFGYHLRPISKKFFFNSCKGWCCFFGS